MNKIQFPNLFEQMGDILASGQLNLVLLLALTALVLSCIAPLLKRRRRRKSQYYPHRVGDRQQQLDMRDPADQMRVVAEARFERRRVMNRSEFLVFQAVERVAQAANRGYRVMAQTSLGEVISAGANATQHGQRQAHAAINSKRIDIAVIDRTGYLALAIEVQGAGHHGSTTTFMRDAVKREALRRAGVLMLEVDPGWPEVRLKQSIEEALQTPAVAKTA